jgi:hypothetical protein
MANNDPITRIDLLEAVAHERELREAFRLESQKALELAQAETARRLDLLNHAHDLAAKNWAHSLPRELFDVYEADHRRRIEALALEINTIQTRNATWMVVLGLALAGFSVVLTAVAIIVGFLM